MLGNVVSCQIEKKQDSFENVSIQEKKDILMLISKTHMFIDDSVCLLTLSDTSALLGY